MEKIRGFILRTNKFNDKKQIVEMYSEARGRLSVVMPLKIKLFPLCIVEISLEFHHNRQLQAIGNATAVNILGLTNNLRINTVKSMMALFIAEFLSKVLREEESNTPLYIYIENALKWLDTANGDFANFIIVLMIKLTMFMGISPNLEGYTRGAFFDLVDGCFSSSPPSAHKYLHPEEAQVIPYLIRMNFTNIHRLPFSRHQRQRCMQVLEEYYNIHLAFFSPMKSMEILSSVFD